MTKQPLLSVCARLCLFFTSQGSPGSSVRCGVSLFVVELKLAFANASYRLRRIRTVLKKLMSNMSGLRLGKVGIGNTTTTSSTRITTLQAPQRHKLRHQNKGFCCGVLIGNKSCYPKRARVPIDRLMRQEVGGGANVRRRHRCTNRSPLQMKRK